MRIISNPDEKQDQYTLDDQFRKSIETQFQDAIRDFYAATDEQEYAEASTRLESTRSILILEYGLTLDEICALVDAA